MVKKINLFYDKQISLASGLFPLRQSEYFLNAALRHHL
jgi:hypothetical protein